MPALFYIIRAFVVFYLFHCDSMTLKGQVLLYLSTIKMANVEINTWESLFDLRLLITILVSSNCCYLLTKKNTLILPKSYLKLILTIHASVLFDMLSGHVFQRRVGIPTGTNCAPICCFIRARQGLLTKNEKKLSQAFTFTFHYADDVLSQNNYTY